MTLRVTHRTHGSDAYLLSDDEGKAWLYSRRTREISEVLAPERLLVRGSWREFDGARDEIEREAEELIAQGPTGSDP